MNVKELSPGKALTEAVKLEKQIKELAARKAVLMEEVIEPHVKKQGQFGVEVDGEEWFAVEEGGMKRQATMGNLQEILGKKEGEKVWKKLPQKESKNVRLRQAKEPEKKVED